VRRVPRDASRQFNRRFRQPAFSIGLEMPGQLPEQELPVCAVCLLAEELQVVGLQRGDVHRGQFFDLLSEDLLHASTS
jgi:hypothetical protein